jgi:hypothetical protein
MIFRMPDTSVVVMEFKKKSRTVPDPLVAVVVKNSVPGASPLNEEMLNADTTPVKMLRLPVDVP